MKEADFWTARMGPRLAEACRTEGLRHHFERVENLVGVGTPDVSYTIAGVAGRIENKFSPRHPVYESTPVLGRKNGLRRSQVIWAYRQLRAGGIVFLLIGTPKTAWLVDLDGLEPQAMIDLELQTVPGLDAKCAWCAHHDSGVALPYVLMKERR